MTALYCGSAYCTALHFKEDTPVTALHGPKLLWLQAVESGELPGRAMERADSTQVTVQSEESTICRLYKVHTVESEDFQMCRLSKVQIVICANCSNCGQSNLLTVQSADCYKSRLSKEQTVQWADSQKSRLSHVKIGQCTYCQRSRLSNVQNRTNVTTIWYAHRI